MLGLCTCAHGTTGKDLNNTCMLPASLVVMTTKADSAC